MKILGAIIAGGKSSRMGGKEKAFLDFGDRPLMAHVVEALRKQTQQVIINANGDPVRFRDLGCKVIADGSAFGDTPLAGMAAVLSFGAAQGFDAVVTTPSDTPFLPPDLVARLSGNVAAIARSGGQDHFLTGFWPAALANKLSDATQALELRRMQDWVSVAKARTVEWPTTSVDPFFNINTPDDLAKALMWVKDQR
jgi:molybdopterin-guanine dinucleotide biosynthesis protein A